MAGNFFENLGYGVRNGYCILRGDRKSLKMLIENNYLGKHIGPEVIKQVDINILAEYADKVFVIGFEELRGRIQIPDGLNDTVDIYLDDRNRSIAYKCKFERVLLITEDIKNDGSFFRTIAESFTKKHAINRYQIDFLPSHGGGERIGHVLETNVREGRFALCIIDIDRKYEGAEANGDTYKNATKSYEQLKKSDDSFRCELYCLECHEIENLIPLSFINDLGKEQREDFEPSVIEVLNAIKECGEAKALLYFDFKKGIDLNDKDNVKREYWNTILDKAGVERTGKERIPGFGRKFLAKVNKH